MNKLFQGNVATCMQYFEVIVYTLFLVCAYFNSISFISLRPRKHRVHIVVNVFGSGEVKYSLVSYQVNCNLHAPLEKVFVYDCNRTRL